MSKLFSVSELACEVQVTPRTIRFYESKGLLNPQRAGRHRVFTHRDLARLKIILRGKRLGFSLADIKAYLDLYDIDPTHASQVWMLRERVRERIIELEGRRSDLEDALRELKNIEQQANEALHSKQAVGGA